MSSQYNNNIAQAIDILLNKRLSDLQYDQTIIAEIYEIVDSANGKYKIQYESVILEAEAIDVTKTYKLNRSVYVKVPKSDFSQKLIIEGAVDSDSTQTGAALKALKNYRIPISPSFEYSDDFTLVAGPENINSNKENPQYITKSYFTSFENEQEIQFRELAKQYEVIKLEATFSNFLLGTHVKGNYGLRFEFLTSETETEEATKTFTLDANKFSGNIFGYNSQGSKQNMYFQVAKGVLKALKSITFFQEDMEQDKNLNNPIMANSKIVDYQKVYTPNLKASDIKITFYDIQDLTEEQMYLHLLAPKGYSGEELNFEAQLLNQGENIINESGYSTYWYKRNPASETKSLAGQGWELATDTSSTTLLLKDIFAIDKYKVIVFDQGKNKVAEKEFEVFPPTISALPSLIQTSMPGQITLSLPEGYVAQWVVDEKIQDEKSQDIKFTMMDFISQTIKVEYSIYNSNNEYLGTAEIHLVAPTEENDIKITFSGIEAYQYDANGDIYLEDAKSQKKMLVATVFGENIQNTTTSQKFYLGENKAFEITENVEDWQKYQNTNSLIENVYRKQTETGNWEIYYTINSKYNINKTNNTIYYYLELNNGEEREYSKEIKFSKVGDLGTTGTSYSSRLSSQQPIFNKQSEADYIIDIEVYINGEKIVNNATEKYEITRAKFYRDKEEFDISNNINYNQQMVIPKEQITGNINYVILTIKIDDNQITNYFGIPVGSGAYEQSPTQYVKYTADGYNPIYQSSSNNPKIPTRFDFSKANDNTYYFENHKVGNILYPIIYFLNSYGNNTINNWDGRVLIDENNNTVLANSVIAGTRKEASDGTPLFTGVIIGNVQDDTKKVEGLYGYKNNQTTFGFKSDGTAYLGSGAGKIEFDGNEAIIRGGGYDLNGDGTVDVQAEMIIDLNAAGTSNNETATAIEIKNQKKSKFSIKYNGNIKGGEAEFENQKISKALDFPGQREMNLTNNEYNGLNPVLCLDDSNYLVLGSNHLKIESYCVEGETPETKVEYFGKISLGELLYNHEIRIKELADRVSQLEEEIASLK